jgi:hypothetical protein
MYTLLLTTHKHPEDAGRVLKELHRTTQGLPTEILVVGHCEEDRPIGKDLPKYKFIVNPHKGSGRSVWAGVQKAKGSWFVYLADDHLYPQEDWLMRIHRAILDNPDIMHIRINCTPDKPESYTNMCSDIGACNTAWYRGHYPAPIYQHYCWDVELGTTSSLEKVRYSSPDIIIVDPYNKNTPGRCHREIYNIDKQVWIQRKKKLRTLFGIQK